MNKTKLTCSMVREKELTNGVVENEKVKKYDGPYVEVLCQNNFLWYVCLRTE